ncbi:MAG: protein-tyrosine phosphatase [Rhodoferax sp.]|jgi:protein-tyrosine phosphatase
MQTPLRSLNLSGASNFRDLGGYIGLDGRSVRWRKLFRSEHLATLTPQDQTVLRELGLQRAYDFRGVNERAATPYELAGIASHSLPIEPTVVQRMKDLLVSGQRLTELEVVALMQETYRAFVNDNAPRFAELFAHLLDSDAPLVFHCTAGKDRTGFAAAMILLALGVPRPVVMQDYLLTNTLLRMDRAPAYGIPPEVMQVLWRVQTEFLDAALHAVEVDHGGAEAYLARQLGVGPSARQRLVAMYLSDVNVL